MRTICLILAIFLGSIFMMSFDNYVYAQNDTLVVEADGDTGIGTDSPDARLDIKGAGSTAGTSALIIRDSSNNVNFVVKDSGDVIIKDNGDVGIGTDTPAADLDVQGDIIQENGTTTVERFIINKRNGTPSGVKEGEIWIIN
ncbi:MAG: hypothetical protein PHP69_04080 [Candidatus Omnitrophica bacterium]|nr:hypothetical protein [Candidatus Omnitrophota bacterium]MDD5080545.1 hypothetical protein [Candidatus Omnitrophota bacterium]